MKKVVGVFVVMIMCLAIPANVLAAANINCANIKTENGEKEFERLIDFIVAFKGEHLETSEEDIVAAVDKQLLSTRGIGDIGNIWGALTNEEKKLVIRYPFDAIKVNSAKDAAFSMTNVKFGYNGLGDRSDAFRHIMWNAAMTVSIGEYKAELFATAHEMPNQEGMESDGFSKKDHTDMDLHNNAIGRQTGKANQAADNEMLANIIYEKIQQEDTNIIWLHE